MDYDERKAIDEMSKQNKIEALMRLRNLLVIVCISGIVLFHDFYRGFDITHVPGQDNTIWLMIIIISAVLGIGQRIYAHFNLYFWKPRNTNSRILIIDDDEEKYLGFIVCLLLGPIITLIFSTIVWGFPGIIFSVMAVFAAYLICIFFHSSICGPGWS